MRRPRRGPEPPGHQRREELTDDEELELLWAKTAQVEEVISRTDYGEDKPPKTRCVIKLQYPVRNLDTWVTQVEMRYPTFRDNEEIDACRRRGGDAEATREMIRRLTQLRGHAINQLAAVDVEAIADAFAGFVDGRPEHTEPEPSSA